MKSHVQKRPMNIQRDVFPWKQTYAWERDLWLVKETYSHEIRRTKKKKDGCISKRDVFPWKETYKQDVCLRERSIIVERDLFTWKTKYFVFKKMCAFFLLRDLFFFTKKNGCISKEMYSHEKRRTKEKYVWKFIYIYHTSKRRIYMKIHVQKRSVTIQRDAFPWNEMYNRDVWMKMVFRTIIYSHK